MNSIAKFTLILLIFFFASSWCNCGLPVESKHSLELVALLSDPDGETRAAAAAELRQLIAANPEAKTNNHGEEYWKKQLESVTAGTKYSEVIKSLPAYGKERSEDWSGRSGNARWRLDHYWTVTIHYRNPDTVIKRPTLENKAMRIWVDAAADFTGTWVTWHVNGQKSHEIEYKNGKFHGSFFVFYDNGQKFHQQYYINGVCSGSASVWYPDGSKKCQGNYTHGKKTGTWIYWNEDGSVDTVEQKN